MLDISLIANLPPFADIAKDALQDLLKQARPVRFNRNDYIFAEGESADSFFLLLDGYIRVVRVTADGEQVIARYISAGELFGVAQALGRDTYPANAIAAADCVVLRWPGEIWPEVISRCPTFATNTYHMVGARLQDAQDRIVEMATERVEQRVAHAIVKLADQTGRQTEDGIVIDFPLSRQDISELTGTTLHTVSRLMSAWEQAGMVKSGRQKITVTEHDRLVTLANHPKD